MTALELTRLVQDEIDQYSREEPQCRWDLGSGFCALSPTGKPWCDLLDWWTADRPPWLESLGLPARQDQRAALLAPGAVALLAPGWTDASAPFVTVYATATAEDVRAQVRSLLPPPKYWGRMPEPVSLEVPVRCCRRCGEPTAPEAELCIDCCRHLDSRRPRLPSLR